MNRIEKIQYLNQILLEEMPEYQETAAWFPRDEASQRCLLRSLMNVRPPIPASQKFLTVQDALLSGDVTRHRKESPAGLMAGRYNHIESRRHRQCSKSRPAGLFLPSPFLY